MTGRDRRIEDERDKVEGGNRKSVTPISETPIERFKSLARKLINVPRAELDEQRKRVRQKKSE